MQEGNNSLELTQALPTSQNEIPERERDSHKEGQAEVWRFQSGGDGEGGGGRLIVILIIWHIIFSCTTVAYM